VTQRVLVTGASGAIGAAIAHEFKRRGAAAIGVHHRGEASRERAEALCALLGEGARRVCFDLRDAAAIDREISAFSQLVGGIDVLVCNAAVFKPDLLATADTDALAETLAVDLLGPMLCARAALPSMLRQRRGVIVMVSSAASVRPNRGQCAYAAAKAGLEGLVRAMAVEYARKGVRVLGVRPGPVESAMMTGAMALAGDEVKARVPMGRLVRAEEVAATVVALASVEQSALTGTIVDVDCGYHLG
jgi:3-oxoacyl-[acyl-carrier protein] reductase